MINPTEYKVTARVAATGDPAVADTGTTNLDIDTTWGGKPGLPGSAELLATAFAACLLKNLARTQDLIAFDYQDAMAATNRLLLQPGPRRPGPGCTRCARPIRKARRKAAKQAA